MAGASVFGNFNEFCVNIISHTLSIPDHSVSLERHYFWRPSTNKLTCWQIHLLWQFDVLQFIYHSNIAKTLGIYLTWLCKKVGKISYVTFDFEINMKWSSMWSHVKYISLRWLKGKICSTINFLIFASLEVGFYEASSLHLSLIAVHLREFSTKSYLEQRPQIGRVLTY